MDVIVLDMMPYSLVASGHHILENNIVHGLCPKGCFSSSGSCCAVRGTKLYFCDGLSCQGIIWCVCAVKIASENRKVISHIVEH